MTKTELRVLQLLTNNGGRMKLREISPQMSRYPSEARNQALMNLETLELVSSAQMPREGKTGGVPGLVYWLTPAGVSHVETLRLQGRIVGKRGA
jgi:predicted transcriptional regulator